MGHDRYEQYISYLNDGRADIKFFVNHEITSSIDTVKYSINQLQDQINYESNRIDELFTLLGPVLDAQAEKPKQKWLWEIFEPNDIEIDFPYNL